MSTGARADSNRTTNPAGTAKVHKVQRPVNLGWHQDCVQHATCADMVNDLWSNVFSSGNYDWPASILELASMDAWVAEHRTARKRAWRSSRLGYHAGPFHREAHVDEIWAVNTSLPERQGRPMSRGYVDRPTFGPLPDYPCPRHRIEYHGAFDREGTLVAYVQLYVSGAMAMISQILGHGDHLQNDVMYLLVHNVLKATPKPVVVFYNRHDSGTDGLRYFKERLGFRPERVAWGSA